MKNKSMYGYMLVVCVVSMILSACDDKPEWGITKIYIPQASVFDGGLTNQYPVPMPEASVNNYLIDEDSTLYVRLGVNSPGQGALSSYDVDVYVDAEATAAAAASINRGVILPSELYTLPDKAVIEGGKEGFFELNVDLKQLNKNYPQYNKNRLIVVVGIANPSQGELNEKLSRVTVIIEGSTFLPVIPIVKGGDFGPGSEANWTIVDVENAPGVMKIDDGKLVVFREDPVSGNGRAICYQPIELEEGKTYKLSVDISITATEYLNRGIDLACAIVPNVPEAGQTSWDYKPGDQRFYFIDTDMESARANGPLVNGTNGYTPFVSIQTFRRPESMMQGEFTALADHQYIAIYLRLRNWKINPVWFDNIKIEEK